MHIAVISSPKRLFLQNYVGNVWVIEMHLFQLLFALKQVYNFKFDLNPGSLLPRLLVNTNHTLSGRKHP